VALRNRALIKGCNASNATLVRTAVALRIAVLCTFSPLAGVWPDECAVAEQLDIFKNLTPEQQQAILSSWKHRRFGRELRRSRVR